jgi:hypothetical protein
MRFVQALPIHRQYIANAMPIQNAMTLFVRKPPPAPHGAKSALVGTMAKTFIAFTQ